MIEPYRPHCECGAYLDYVYANWWQCRNCRSWWEQKFTSKADMIWERQHDEHFNLRAIHVRSMLCLLVMLCASRVQATPILLPMHGCVMFDTLQGPIEWNVAGHIEVGEFHDQMSGCDATVADPHSFLILDDEEYLSSAILIPANLEPCGRYQFDVQLGDDHLTMQSLVVNTGVNCDIEPPHTPPTEMTAVPEASTLVLLSLGVAANLLKNKHL